MSSTAESTQGMRLLAAAEAGEDLGQRLEQLNAIGASLSAERDINRLLESILTAAKTITRADGGTLYRVTDEKTLRFEIVRTTSLQYYLGGTTGTPVPFYPIHLMGKDGKPNHAMVAAHAAAHREDGQHSGRLHRRGLRLLGHPQFRQEDRLPLQVVPHGADEEPRARDHRRAAVDQRAAPEERRHRRVFRPPTSASRNRSPRRRRSRSPTAC